MKTSDEAAEFRLEAGSSLIAQLEGHLRLQDRALARIEAVLAKLAWQLERRRKYLSTNERRQASIVAIIDNLRSQGLTVKQACAKQGISPITYQHYRRVRAAGQKRADETASVVGDPLLALEIEE